MIKNKEKKTLTCNVLSNVWKHPPACWRTVAFAKPWFLSSAKRSFHPQRCCAPSPPQPAVFAVWSSRASWFSCESWKEMHRTQCHANHGRSPLVFGNWKVIQFSPFNLKIFHWKTSIGFKTHLKDPHWLQDWQIPNQQFTSKTYHMQVGYVFSTPKFFQKTMRLVQPNTVQLARSMVWCCGFLGLEVVAFQLQPC